MPIWIKRCTIGIRPSGNCAHSHHYNACAVSLFHANPSTQQHSQGILLLFGRGRFLMENCHKHIRHCTNLSLSLASSPYSTLVSNLRHSAWPFARSKRPTATQRIFARAKSRDRRPIGLGIFGNLKCHVIFEMPAELIS